MTVRAILNRRFKRAAFAVYGGVAVFLLVVLAQTRTGAPPQVNYLGFAGMVVALLAYFGASLLLTCPACDERIFRFLWGSGGHLRVDPRIKCCPYCGQDFDAECQRADGTPARGK